MSREIDLGALKFDASIGTETLLIVGKRGSGKSSTATRLFEQLVRFGHRAAVLDPVDVWWGVKAGADGKRDGGLEVVVFGGEHADMPLRPEAGALMADILVEHTMNAVMVLRGWSNRDRCRFVADFADRLFARNRDALHLFCEEAHQLMPQSIQFKGTGEEEMLGRMLRLQTMGRSSGIGLTSITQRPAALNKNATTQAEILIAHRIIGPQDRDAVDEWIKHHDHGGQRAEVLGSLAQLGTGEAWVWAPDFPRVHPVGLVRVRIAAPDTFDSRATPKAGKAPRQPKAMRAVDLDALRSKMEATVAAAAADDPKALRAQVLDLKKQAATLTAKLDQMTRAFDGAKNLARAAVDKVTMKRGPSPIPPKLVSRIEQAVTREEKIMERVDAIVERLLGASKASHDRRHDLRSAIAALLAAEARPPGPAERSLLALPPAPLGPANGASRPATGRPEGRAPISPTRQPDGALPAMQRAFLIALAQHPHGLQKGQILTHAGYASSGATSRAFADLVRNDWMRAEGPVQHITSDGIVALGQFDPLPLGEDLQRHVLSRESPMEAAILRVLFAEHPAAIAKGKILEVADYKSSGATSRAFARLVRMGYAVNERGALVAAPEFFS